MLLLANSHGTVSKSVFPAFDGFPIKSGKTQKVIHRQYRVSGFSFVSRFRCKDQKQTRNQKHETRNLYILPRFSFVPAKIPFETRALISYISLYIILKQMI